MVGGEAKWRADLKAWRQRKDDWLRSGAGFLSGAALEGFAGLRYFEPDPAYVLELPVARAAGAFAPEVAFATSDGGQKWWAAFGTVSVQLPSVTVTSTTRAASVSVPHALTVFTMLGEERPESGFVPFHDATSGAETYGMGRYLDVPLAWSEQGVRATLDFNRAYHPACAYADGYSCPLPPPEHWLEVAVRAGERLAEQL